MSKKQIIGICAGLFMVIGIATSAYKDLSGQAPQKDGASETLVDASTPEPTIAATSTPEPTKTPLVADTSLQATLQLQLEERVLNNLKSPATAVFCKASEYKYKESDTHLTIVGYVDSQNSFGALLRSEIAMQCEIDGDSYNVNYLKIGDNATGTYIK